jgi:hypothetical protein
MKIDKNLPENFKIYLKNLLDASEISHSTDITSISVKNISISISMDWEKYLLKMIYFIRCIDIGKYKGVCVMKYIMDHNKYIVDFAISSIEYEKPVEVSLPIEEDSDSFDLLEFLSE